METEFKTIQFVNRKPIRTDRITKEIYIPGRSFSETTFFVFVSDKKCGFHSWISCFDDSASRFNLYLGIFLGRKGLKHILEQIGPAIPVSSIMSRLPFVM